MSTTRLADNLDEQRVLDDRLGTSEPPLPRDLIPVANGGRHAVPPTLSPNAGTWGSGGTHGDGGFSIDASVRIEATDRTTAHRARPRPAAVGGHRRRARSRR